MTAPTDSPALRAEFNPLVRPYLVVYGTWLLLLSIIGILFIPFWILGIGQWWASHYFRKLKCELDDRHLNFRKGILFQIEKTIPLENIQDVTFIEGPLLRRFSLSILRMETAGQSPGQAHNMSLVGIVDAHRLRAEILRRRELVRRQTLVAPPTANDGDDDSLRELRAIRERLDEIAMLLRSRGD